MRPTRTLSLGSERLADLATDELGRVAAAAPPTQQCPLTQVYTNCFLFLCDFTGAECT